MKPIYFTFLVLPACSTLSQVGKVPAFSPLEGSYQHHAVYAAPMQAYEDPNRSSDASSLWTATQASLLGDRRASKRGDILTVVIEIDDKAEISNNSSRGRSSEQNMSLPSLFGIPQRVDRKLPEGASMDDAAELESSSKFSGSGKVSRKEKLTLRIAATIVEVLPNGVLRLEGQQEVRVNYELRELIVTGFIRPADITRQNEVTYDKIAGARISYGGRGQISEIQQPRYGQQISEILLPF